MMASSQEGASVSGAVRIAKEQARKHADESVATVSGLAGLAYADKLAQGLAVPLVERDQHPQSKYLKFKLVARLLVESAEVERHLGIGYAANRHQGLDEHGAGDG